MFSLRLRCSSEEAEFLSAELWEFGTVAVGEEAEKDGQAVLLAGFESDGNRDALLIRFAQYAPLWQEDTTDWIGVTEKAWPPRAVGEKLFLAPPWCSDPTPQGRQRIVHNPGLASGTGEHPCTQLVLESLERCLCPGMQVLDVGTGSGILSLASLQWGASLAISVDPDDEALQTARENFQLNHLIPVLINGSADCIIDRWADVTVANISGTVLLSLLGDLLRVTKRGGLLILSGFTVDEAPTFLRLFPQAEQITREGWVCLTARQR